MNYNFITESVKPKTVTVITPTIGLPKLLRALYSVQNQTYKHHQHLIVADGPEAWENVKNNKLMMFNIENNGVAVNVLHENVGKNGFYGHRVYAAFPHLVNSDYIFLLDEDNWYEPDHIETLVKTLEEGNDVMKQKYGETLPWN